MSSRFQGGPRHTTKQPNTNRFSSANFTYVNILPIKTNKIRSKRELKQVSLLKRTIYHTSEQTTTIIIITIIIIIIVAMFIYLFLWYPICKFVHFISFFPPITAVLLNLLKMLQFVFESHYHQCSY